MTGYKRYVTPLLACAIALLCLGPWLAGCGKKTWPEPKADAERFDFKDLSSEIKDGCLAIKSRIKGKKENLAKLTLELTESGGDADCPGCPFIPQTKVEVALDAPNLKFNGLKFTLTHCDIKPGVNYRWRLIGANAYPGIGNVVTRAVLTTVGK